MNEQDTHEIVVDAANWPSSRAALAEVVAAVLGVPPHRVRPLIDHRDQAVASYVHQEEADRVAESLAVRGVDVAVRRRLGRRRSLAAASALAAGAEVTAPAVPASGAVAPPVQPPTAPASQSATAESPVVDVQRTIMPGWQGSFAREEGRAAFSVTPAGTFIGHAPDPAELAADAHDEALLRQLGPGGTPSDPLAPSHAALSPAPPPAASAAGGLTNGAATAGIATTAAHGAAAPTPTARSVDGAAPPPAAAAFAADLEAGWDEAMAETLMPADGRSGGPAGGNGWSDILGAALAERLVAEDFDGDGAALPVRAANFAPPPPPTRPASESGAVDIVPDVIVGEAVDDTHDLVDSTDRSSQPTPIVPPEVAAAAAGRAFDAAVERGAGTPAGAGGADGAADSGASSAARAHDAAERSRVAMARLGPVGVGDARRIIKPVDNAPSGATIMLGSDPWHIDEPPAASDDAAPTAGDRFVRLRRDDSPEARSGDVRAATDARLPSVAQTRLWSLAAPGGGFAYLGAGDRALTAALASVFVVPWGLAVRDAVAEAREIEDGHRLASRAAQPAKAAQFVAAYWVVVALVVAGGVWGYQALAARQPPPVLLAPVPPPPPEPAPPPPPELPRAGIDDETRARVMGLVTQARVACQGQQWASCRMFAEEALALDERNPAALRLHVQAISEGRTLPPTDPTEEPRE